MPYHPKKILWLISGNMENDSLLNIVQRILPQQTPKEWDDVEHTLVTNSKAYTEFPGKTYRIREDMMLGPSMIERILGLLQAALAGGFIHEADIVIVPFISLATMVNLMDTGGVVKRGTWMRRKPVIIVSPKVPVGVDSDCAEFQTTNRFFWYFVARSDNIWTGVLDNDYERELMIEEMRKEYPQTNLSDHVFNLAMYKFTGFKDIGVEKEDVVVWQGRNNPDKGYPEAVEILTMLTANGVKCRMFIPSSSLFRMGEIERINARLFECNVGMDRDLYMRNQCSAKCCIICSNTEAWPPGYIEQLERGCVPVIRKKPWMKTFLTEDWPLVFTDKGEAVEMAK